MERKGGITHEGRDTRRNRGGRGFPRKRQGKLDGDGRGETGGFRTAMISKN